MSYISGRVWHKTLHNSAFDFLASANFIAAFWSRCALVMPAAARADLTSVVFGGTSTLIYSPFFSETFAWDAEKKLL